MLLDASEEKVQRSASAALWLARLRTPSALWRCQLSTAFALIFSQGQEPPVRIFPLPGPVVSLNATL